MDVGAGSGTWLHRHVSGGTHFKNRSEVSRGKRADLERARFLWSAGWTGRDLLTVDVVGLISGQVGEWGFSNNTFSLHQAWGQDACQRAWCKARHRSSPASMLSTLSRTSVYLRLRTMETGMTLSVMP